MANQQGVLRQFFALFLGSLVSSFLAVLVILFPPTSNPWIVLTLGGAILVLCVIGVLVWQWRNLRALARSVAKFFAIFVPIIFGMVCIGGFWFVNLRTVPDFEKLPRLAAQSAARESGLVLDMLQAQDADDQTPITYQQPPVGTRLMRGGVVRAVVGVMDVSVAITDPPDGGMVFFRQSVSGTSKGVAQARGKLQLNILLNPRNAPNNWWVYGPLPVDSDGRWITEVNFGQEVESGTFELRAIVTTEKLRPQGDGGGKAEYSSVPVNLAESKVVVTRK